MPKSSRKNGAAPVPSPPSATRFVCIHGHFYQPPRDNPWLETVEVQDSAAPYHDWNERITSECYAPNGASRISNRDNEIIRIVNNYARMSFNFGPTLLSWLADKAHRTYRMILDADAASATRYSGHGSAMAQNYNHIIMPLASERDARTQIRWGIADFEHRFGRRPEGMWLAETAVSRWVLDLMAQEGIRFTVLAPNQCARVRPSAAGADAPAAWTDTSNSTVDPTHPYRVPLDDGRSIAVFFYDGPTSRAIAFEGLLNSGEIFGKRLLGGFRQDGAANTPQLVHVATDGESYGHHHTHGEMALSYAMHWIEESGGATLTNYGEFLERFPPAWEAEVIDDTSWSCAHGIERWRSNCGCNGGKPGWNQQWRKPLREALDLLRDRTAPLAEKLAQPLLHDVWAARDAYIDVILDRQRNAERFLEEHSTRALTAQERIQVWQLMELERHAQLMYTSCGWFFDELSGIETVQIIAYAGRVIQLAQSLFGDEARDLEQDFLALLAEAKSNLPEIGDGAAVYRRNILGMRVGLEQVGAHYAISSVFREYPEHGSIFCYDIRRDGHEVLASGRGRVALGRACVQSLLTEESEDVSYAVLHLGDQNLSAAVKRFDPATPGGLDTFTTFSQSVQSAVLRADLPSVIRVIDRFFGGTTYSLTSLFADEQHRILRTVLDRTVSEMEDSLSKIYEDHASLLYFLTDAGMAAPPALALAAGYAVNASLRRALEADIFDDVVIASLLNRARQNQITLDTPLLSYTAGQRMKRAMHELERAAIDPVRGIAELDTAVLLAVTLQKMPFEVNLWQSQNMWNDLLQSDADASWPAEWKTGFRKLGIAMNIAVDRLVVEEGVSVFAPEIHA